MRHLEAYAAGGDAYERGEPVQPPVTIPSHRKDAWLKGWAEQRAFLERQVAGRKQELPAAADAPRSASRGCQWPLDEPFRAFPSWFLRIECDRCGKVAMLNEAHTTGRRREMPLRALLARMRHDGCGGIAGKAELLTGIDGVSSRPVRKIVLRSG